MFKWSARKDGETAAVLPPAATPVETTTSSKVLPRFLATLAAQPAPVLLDLGPVVGANVAFFGERLACKLYVEDLFADVEAHARRPDKATSPLALAERLTQPPQSVDGILCWDLFDYLDKATALALASKLAGMLRSGGALHAFFGSTQADLSHYTRYVLEGDAAFRIRTYPATPVRRHVFVTRDINRMFDGLDVAESVLLKTNTRETLFRKP